MQSVEFFKKQIKSEGSSQEPLVEQLLAYAAKIETELALLKYRSYGRSSEKFIDPRQESLFNEIEQVADDQESQSEEDLKPGSENKKGNQPHKARAKKLHIPENIERQRHVHDLSDEEKKCTGCGVVMNKTGEDITEKVDIIPAKVIAREDVYVKYACGNSTCDGLPKQASRPASSIGKIMATTAMLSFIAAQKYHLGVPLYRLEGLFSSFGIRISRYVMSLWMIKAAEALRPIYLTLEENLLSSGYIHMDETGLQVLKEEGRPATSKSYMWVRRTGLSQGPPIILYSYSPSRSAAVAQKLLQGFEGFLQSDDYVGYSAIARSNEKIEHLLCWDHTRRYFWEAYQAIPKKKRGNTVAERALKIIKKIYTVEKNIKNKTDDEILKMRATVTKPQLDKLRTLCENNLASLGANTPTTKAINYMLDNWFELLVYLNHAHLNISNSPAEQAVRPLALGRKAWLFSNTPRGAEASALLYSLVVTAKANGWDPFAYLQFALDGVAKAETADDLGKLLPTRNMVN